MGTWEKRAGDVTERYVKAVSIEENKSRSFVLGKSQVCGFKGSEPSGERSLCTNMVHDLEHLDMKHIREMVRDHVVLHLVLCFIFATYYRLKVHVPPKFVSWNLTPSVMVWGGEVFGRSCGWSLQDGISALIRESPESLLCCPILWRHPRRHHLWTRRHWICWRLDLGRLISRLWGMNFCCL